jgi:hypothetical protein
MPWLWSRTPQFLCTTTRLSSQSPNSDIRRRKNQWRYKYPDVLLWTKLPSFLANLVCEKTQFFVERESLFMLQPELWCQRL